MKLRTQLSNEDHQADGQDSAFHLYCVVKSVTMKKKKTY